MLSSQAASDDERSSAAFIRSDKMTRLLLVSFSLTAKRQKSLLYFVVCLSRQRMNIICWRQQKAHPFIPAKVSILHNSFQPSSLTKSI